MYGNWGLYTHMIGGVEESYVSGGVLGVEVVEWRRGLAGWLVVVVVVVGEVEDGVRECSVQGVVE